MALVDQIGNDVAEFLLKFAEVFEKENSTPEEIAKKLQILPIFMVNFLIVLVYNNNQIALSEKLFVAKNLYLQKKIKTFKKAVEDGSHELYFTTIPTIDKYLLEIAMELVLDPAHPRILTEQEKIYKDLIEKSIQQDKKQETRSQFSRTKKYNS